MDLRNLPETLAPHERCAVRRMKIQDLLGINLSLLGTEPNRIGLAEEKNCEQMFGTVPVPVGYAGPLSVVFSSKETCELHLPLATTEGALVASVNRGCKAIAGVHVTSVYHGISRTICWKTGDTAAFRALLEEKKEHWSHAAEATSKHLTIIGHTIDVKDEYVFLTINADTDEAMGMNMVTIAAQVIGDTMATPGTAELITIAANIDSDKKPSKRTHDLGRGYEVTAEVLLTPEIIRTILKTEPEKLLEVAQAKLNHGSHIAGALGANLHAANSIAALYLATGQDVAHTVEGSLADTTVTKVADGISVTVRLPAVLVGVRGGGTALPAQNQCLTMLMKPTIKLKPRQQLAESIGAAVLAGEVSLLAAQAAGQLASSHKKLAR